MKQKVLSFITYNRRLLALYSEPHPEHGEGGWFLVTGEVEKNETQKEAVAREILEETGLYADEIFPLNWGSIYNWNNKTYKEINFLSFVNKQEVVLNEENTEYKWLNLDEFIKLIKWEDNKEILKKVLQKALRKENHFKEENIVDYR